jgi:hypothetical protein
MIKLLDQSTLEQCVDQGVTERPPVAGKHYVAFIVHPRHPGPVTLAIAHREGEMRVLDLVRDGLTIQQARDLAHAYDIHQVTGIGNDDDGRNLALAVAGALSLLQGQEEGT